MFCLVVFNYYYYFYGFLLLVDVVVVRVCVRVYVMQF